MNRARFVPPSDRSDLLDGLKLGVVIAAAVLVSIVPLPAGHHAPAAHGSTAPATQIVAPALVASVAPRHADFAGQPASADAVHVANWVADSGDNGQRPFVVIDKKNAHVHVFDASARLIGSTPVLLGAAAGDDSVAGIGKRPIAEVRPEERTTPAGRFVTEPGRNANGEDVIWVDYDAAVSMHRVRIVDPKERRLERLASSTSADNRISYGCINVPVAFFETVLSPTLRSRHGVAYVLPETRSVQQVFGSYDVDEKNSAALASSHAARLAAN